MNNAVDATFTSGVHGLPPAAPSPPPVAVAVPAARRPPMRPRSRWRWRLRWGRPLPWPTRVEILATLGLWLGGALGWEHWQATRPLLPAAPASTALSLDAARPLVTVRRPDADGLYVYRQDRLEVRSPVTLRQLPRDESRPEATRVRGQRENLKFELTRTFDFRARFTDATDLAHESAAAICQAAGADLINAEDNALSVSGQPAVHTVMRARLRDGRGLTVEGLTIDEGTVAWSMWAGYPSDDAHAALVVQESFRSAVLQPLAARKSPPDDFLW